MTYDRFVELLENEIQIAALAFMATLYAVKVWRLMQLNPVTDRTPDRGDPDAGARYSLMLVAMPWELASYRSHPIKYAEFVAFHLAIAAAILSTFLIPYAPGLLAIPAVKALLMLLIAAGLVSGVSRLLKRLASPALRAVSTVDDYFSILLLDAYYVLALLAIPDAATHRGSIAVFFGLTAFFLCYVPFSKICHYLLWPFARYYIGKHFGKRGVYPKKAGSARPGRAMAA
ncbi:MAG: hypothetical protein NTW86_02745 [Candidatus Sumerlaeota bacterium]|nr:hypothetical protein [Candidatus Sumerlaeota bacterium]